jgi:hypothetical protein
MTDIRGFVNAPRTIREPYFRVLTVRAPVIPSCAIWREEAEDNPPHIYTAKFIAVCVEDLDDGHCSVTNGAELVVREVIERLPAVRAENLPIVYRDSTGRWDRLNHRDGEFTGFLPLGASTMEDAVRIALKQLRPLD